MISIPTAILSPIITFAAIGVGISMLSLVKAEDEQTAETVTVSCTCKTKQYESWCKLGSADWEIHHYWRTAETNPNIEWDEEFTRTYCYRHKDNACLCDDEPLFSGTVG